MATRRKTHETDASQARRAADGGLVGVVPQVLLGAVDGVGVVAGGLLQLGRNVLLTAVSGAADIGAEALDATVSGARGVVSATSRMVGDMAGAARTTFAETVSLARQARGRRPVRPGIRKPLAAMGARPAVSEPEAPRLRPEPSRRPTRRARAGRPSRGSAAA